VLRKKNKEEQEKEQMAAAGHFVLPPLPYAQDALVPAISAETVSFHYGKHHAGYVTKLNAVTAGTEQATQTLEHIVRHGHGTKAFNAAAQTWNHTFYWEGLGPVATSGGAPDGPLGEAIARDFGSFENFRKQFTEVAVNHFGSGWAWLVVGADGKLQITETHDADCPLRHNQKPILTCDLWEHAYYIDYRNARPQYVEAWWTIVNWTQANKVFAQAHL
jgi:Fe-Mn family superoxide dismutase